MGKQRGDRLFSCERCGALVSICRTCDRGNRYCSRQCSRASRAESSRRSNARYRRTPIGRRNQRRRQKAYRARQAVAHAASEGQPRGFACPLGTSPTTDKAVVSLGDRPDQGVRDTHVFGRASSLIIGTVTHHGSLTPRHEVPDRPDRLGTSSPHGLSTLVAPASSPRRTCCVCGRPVSTHARFQFSSGEDPG